MCKNITFAQTFFAGGNYFGSGFQVGRIQGDTEGVETEQHHYHVLLRLRPIPVQRVHPGNSGRDEDRGTQSVLLQMFCFSYSEQIILPT